MQRTPLTAVFALYPNLTQLDFTGPHEVLARVPGVRIVLASAAGGPVVSENGLVFAGTERLADVPACDLLCVPGGPGLTAAMGDRAFLAELKRLGEGARWLTSVCTGSLLLGAAGLIKGRRAACHWASRDLLRIFGAEPVAERVVRDGPLITGGGVTAGIDFALAIAAEIAGLEAAQAIQLMIEYAPAPPFEAGDPESAPPEVLEQVLAQVAQWMPARRRAAEAVGAG
jgi:transcriptional regulator GlxA family with amidase domain